MLFLSPLRNKRRLGGRFLAVLGLESASCATYLFFSCQSHPQLFSNVLALFIADKGPMWVYMLEVSLGVLGCFARRSVFCSRMALCAGAVI